MLYHTMVPYHNNMQIGLARALRTRYVQPGDVLRRKRDGHALAASELQGFIAGIADGRLSDGQLGAFAMAVCLRGMDRDHMEQHCRDMLDLVGLAAEECARTGADLDIAPGASPSGYSLYMRSSIGRSTALASISGPVVTPSAKPLPTFSWPSERAVARLAGGA